MLAVGGLAVAWVAIAATAAGLDQQKLVTAPARFTNPMWSPDGVHLALTSGNSDGVYVLDTATGDCVAVTDAPSSGYAYNWSADGRYLGFKLLLPRGPGLFPWQQPVLFDVQTQQLVALHEPVARAGVPSFSAGGLIAFTIDTQLQVLAPARKPLKTFSLETYANLAPISPDGSQVVYNRDDQIWAVELAGGNRRQLTRDNATHFAPVWSPDSGKLVVGTLTGRLKSIDVPSGHAHDLGPGTCPSWAADSSTVYFCDGQRLDGIELVRSDVCTVQWDSPASRRVLDGAMPFTTSARISPDGTKLAAVDLAGGNVDQFSKADSARFQRDKAVAGANTKTAKLKSSAPATLSATAGGVITLAQLRVAGTVPYIHQVYDTPNWFNGNWACNATSAMMALQYYGTLPNWDCTVSIPYSHVSHFGRYICETYSFRGYTYNTASPDPNGTNATGGYGYIVRNDWADTKGYMRDYIIQHGLTSSVDWSPTWAELRTEVNNSNPFVLLNSLTSAGHYIVTIGYFDSQYTAIFNDPYGNKNSGYVNYNGAGVYYDWPGYNNGYSNLNTVWCFIYCRGSIVAPTITQSPTNQTVCGGGTTSFSVTATGSGTLSYQWQKNSVDLSNGGHYTGVTTSTLTVSLADATDVANYRCVVTNTGGSATSNAASLGLIAGTSIQQQPVGQRVTAGGTAQFTVVATGEGTPAYQWRKNGVSLSDGGHYSGATSATLNVTGCDGNDVGRYQCVVTAGCGSVTSTAVALQIGQPGDFDEDTDVDQEDWGIMQLCLGLTGLGASPACAAADLNADDGVSITDATLFVGCMTSPGVAGQTNCTPVP